MFCNAHVWIFFSKICKAVSLYVVNKLEFHHKMLSELRGLVELHKFYDLYRVVSVVGYKECILLFALFDTYL